MATYADMPWWLIMVIIFAFIGPMSRMGRSSRRHWPQKALPDEEVRRLESALGERDQVIEDLQRRIGEMEERLDFTERLIAARKHEPVA